MKAIVYHRYGSPDVLRCEELERPAPRDHEVLIEVQAASVNPLDWHFIRGEPYVIRLATGLRRPRRGRAGVDVAGRVVEVGGMVTRFRPGDAVFGTSFGALAEYVCANETKLAAKPENLTFEEAAAVPVAGVTALQGLRDKRRILPGQTVLINGAAGGVGTFAVQIAKSLGANVTGVCSTRNVELVRSLGADQTIDYTRENLLEGGPRYDFFFDCAGKQSLVDLRRTLRPKGIYVGIAGPGGPWIGPFIPSLQATALSPFVSQKLCMHLASVKEADLLAMKELLEAGTVRPVIDTIYRLAEAPEAVRHLEGGHARGKIVIRVKDGEPGQRSREQRSTS